MAKDFKSEKATFKSENCVMKACPICLFKNYPSELKLGGIPSSCEVDNYYFLTNSSALIGRHGKSEILFSDKESQWELFNKFKDKTAINNERLLHSGTSDWNGTCGAAFRTKFNLHKSVKQPGFFCCDDGSCISSDFVCDGHFYCDDKSDEKICPVVIFEKNHNKNYPPKRKDWDIDTKGPTEVETKISILNVLTVDQSEHLLDIIAKVEFTWNDSRLSFPFLKSNSYENDINETYSAQIWTPRYDLLYLEEFTDIIHKISVVKHGLPRMFEDPTPLELYNGAENSLLMEIIFRGKLLCSFANMGEYPFAADHCNFTIYLKENRLATLKLVDLGKLHTDNDIDKEIKCTFTCY